jgi:hypothetical protein
MLPAFYTLRSLRFLRTRNARAYTSVRSIGFCVIWVCISSSSSYLKVLLGFPDLLWLWAFPVPRPLFPL